MDTTIVAPGLPQIEFFMPFPYAGMNRHIWAAHDRMFDWLTGHDLLPNASNLSVLKGSRCDLLSGCFYAEADLPTLELLDQFMGWGFVVDDQVDDGVAGLDAPRVRAVVEEQVAVLNDSPPTPLTPLGTALADWWKRTKAISSASWRRQFVDSTTRWLRTLIIETDDLSIGRTPDMDEYLSYREHSIATRTYSGLCELGNHAQLTDSVRALPAYERMRTTMCTQVALANDVLSFDKQRDVGRQTDAITILVHTRGCSVDQAMRTVAAMADEQLHAFLEAEKQFFVELDQTDIGRLDREHANTCVEAFHTQMRASLEWEIFAIERFGEDTRYLRGNAPDVIDVLVQPAPA